MSATDRILAVGGSRDAATRGAASDLLRDALEGVEGVVLVDDLEAALARLDADATGGTPTALAVLGPDVERPLSTALELRRAHDSLPIAFVVEASQAEAMEIRLGLMPDLRGATVVVAEGAPGPVREALRGAVDAAARHREVRHALDHMNRQLLRHPELEDATPRESVSESYLAALTRHLPEAIVSVDGDGRVVAMNEAAGTTFGIRPEAAEGATLTSVLGPADGELRPLVADALAGRTRSGEEITLDTGAAERMLASFTAAPVRDHAGRIVGAVLVVRDITQQRRTEDRLRQLQKAQSLATLAGGVAHDFNNLLVGVKGWAELAAEDPEDLELVTKALDRIQTSAERAADLARSMLVYSGRGRFELESVDLRAVVRDMADLLHGTVGAKTELVLELADDLPPVEADASQLRQVVMNLITNAAEALEGASGRITLRVTGPERPGAALAEELRPAGEYLVVEVSDTGPGMDEATAQRVFEPFFTTKFEGRGLGLAASHGIVRAHGGTLTVSSRPGDGATFRMLLPALTGPPT